MSLSASVSSSAISSRDGAAAVDRGAADRGGPAASSGARSWRPRGARQRARRRRRRTRREPDAREVVADLEEEHAATSSAKAAVQPRRTRGIWRMSEVKARVRVEAEHVEAGDGHERGHGDRGHVERAADDRRLVDVESGDGEAEEADDGEVAARTAPRTTTERDEARLVVEAEVGEARDCAARCARPRPSCGERRLWPTLSIRLGIRDCDAQDCPYQKAGFVPPRRVQRISAW